MSNEINDGGPAFPLALAARETDEGLVQRYDAGMSLRDYFAGQALLLAGAYAITMVLDGKKPPMKEEDMAQRAYATADALLKARNPQPTQP